MEDNTKMFLLCLGLIITAILVCFALLHKKRIQKYLTKNKKEEQLISATDLSLNGDTIDCFDQIAEGAFGTVYRGNILRNGQKFPVALKTGQCRAIKEEGDLMVGLDHRNIIKFVRFYSMDDKLAIIMELAPTGALSSFLRQNSGNTSSKLLHSFCLDIATGMEYLAKHQIIHRDLSCRNCLLSTDGVKICDFGSAISRKKFHFLSKTKSPPKLAILQLPPESILSLYFTEKSDVWSFGILLWEMYSEGQIPYRGVYWETNEQFAALLQENIRPSQKELITICSVSCRALMEKCCVLSAKQRPTFKQIRKELQLLTDL